MKKGLIITTALAMVLGVGVAVGAHQGQAYKEVKALGDTVLYCKMTYDWWKKDGAAIGCYYWISSDDSDNNAWPGDRMTPVENDTDVWKFYVPEGYDRVIFTRVNGTGGVSDWGAKTGDLIIPTDGKNLYTITSETAVWGDPGVTGEWSIYKEPEDPTITFSYNGSPIGNNEGHWMNGTEENSVVAADTFDMEKLGYSVSEGANVTVSWTVDDKPIVAPTNPLPAGTYKFQVNVAADATYNAGSNYVKFKISDLPNSDGYYVVGSKTHFTFVGSQRMNDALQNIDGNEAYLYEYTAEKDESIKVHKYVNDVSTWSYYDGGAKDFGAPDGDANFVFNKAGTFDIWAKTVAGELKFYIEEHTADMIQVGVVNRFFRGSTLHTYENGLYQYGRKGEVFTPKAPAVDGSTFRGFFNDIACTLNPYVPAVLNYETTLYAKFIEHGFYLLDGQSEYSIDTAKYMNTLGIDVNNKAEILINVANANESYSCVYYNGEMAGQSGLGNAAAAALIGITYDSANGGHFTFANPGTYSIYFGKDNNVYFNTGAIAFCTNFISEIGGICNDNGSTDLDALKEEWALQEDAFNALGEEKAVLQNIGFNGGNEDGTLAEQVIAKYHYIVWKYGTANFNDFIFGQENVDPHQLGDFNYIDNSATSAIVYVIAALSLTTLSVGLFVMLKKKKEN